MKSIEDYQAEIKQRTQKCVSEESLYKLGQLILYVAWRCEDDPTFGATKLNKILYYADFVSYAEYGEPITGVPYMKLDNGPAPVHLVPIREKMIKDKEIILREQPFYKSTQKRIIPLVEPNLKEFSGRDIALVDYVIEQLHGHTATDVSELSHRIAWKIAEDREVIPYEAGLLLDEGTNLEDIAEGKRLAEMYGW